MQRNVLQQPSKYAAVIFVSEAPNKDFDTYSDGPLMPQISHPPREDVSGPWTIDIAPGGWRGLDMSHGLLVASILVQGSFLFI